MATYNSIEDLLTSLFNSEGLEILNNPVQIKGLISDYFPQKSKENYAIKACLDKGFSKKLYLAITQDNHLSQLEISQLKDICVSELWMSDDALNYVMDTFVNAIRRSKYSSQIKISSTDNNTTNKATSKNRENIHSLNSAKTNRYSNDSKPSIKQNANTNIAKKQSQGVSADELFRLAEIDLANMPDYSTTPVSNQMSSATTNTRNNSSKPDSTPKISSQKKTNNQSSTESGSAAAGCFTLIVIVGIIIFLFHSCFGVSSNTQSTTSEATTESITTYSVTLNVECEANRFLNKYDVTVLIDDNELGKLDHGETKTFTAELTKGKHIITFHEYHAKGIDGNREVVVSGPTSYTVKIHCEYSQVEIKKFEETAIAKKTTVETSEYETGILNNLEKTQRDGFNNNINKKVQLTNYSVEIPMYWIEDYSQKKDESTIQKHVSGVEYSSGFVRLLYLVEDDPNNESVKYWIANKNSASMSIVNGVGGSNHSLIKQEIATFGDATGLLTVIDMDIEKNGSAYRVRIYNFVFASTEEQKYVAIMLTESENAKYSYYDDYAKTLNSLTKKGQEDNSD